MHMPNNTKTYFAVLGRVSGVTRLQQLGRVSGVTRLQQLGRASGVTRLQQLGRVNWCKIALSASFLVIVFILSSCNSVPPGKPPEGPIVTPEIKMSVFDRKSAVDFMVTSIATRCTPISSAGINLPHIVNEFTASSGAVNNMPIELWQSLIRMKMILPVDENDSKKQYKLLSEIKEIKVSAEKKDYLWELKLVSLQDNAEIWKDTVEFVVMNEASGT
jgi:hypothetical protein